MLSYLGLMLLSLASPPSAFSLRHWLLAGLEVVFHIQLKLGAISMTFF